MKVVEDCINYYDNITNKSILTFDEWEYIYIVFYENYDVLELLYSQDGEIEYLDSRGEVINLLLENKVICQNDNELNIYIDQVNGLNELQKQKHKYHS